MSFLRLVIWYLRGKSEFTRTGYEAAAKRFNPKDLEVDISGRSYVITGANSGLGLSLAISLAEKGAAAIHMVCRNKERGEKAVNDVKQQSGNNNVFLHIVDMSSAKDVYRFATDLKESNTPVDVLINNAGCMVHKKEITSEGLESNFACNTFGVYVLTTALIPLLKSRSNPRVVTVSSGGMYLEGLDAADIQLEKRPFKGDVCYEQQKRQQVVMMEMLAKTYPEIGFYSMHPGWADTPAFREALPDFYEKMKHNVRTPAQGADTALWLSISSAVSAKDNGAFFQDRAPVNKHLFLAGTSRPESDQIAFMRSLDSLAEKLNVKPKL